MADLDRKRESEISLLEAKCKYFVKNADVLQSDGGQAYPEVSPPVLNERIFRREDWQTLTTSCNSFRVSNLLRRS